MTGAGTERAALQQRLDFLRRIVGKEAEHLTGTTERLFRDTEDLTPDAVRQWIDDPVLSERLDAFVSRFSRLQDTLGDKLVPALLDWTGEPRGPAIDNLDKAEKFGWISSADEWLSYRQLRNQMVHEYIEDLQVLAEALDRGRAFVPELLGVARALTDEVDRRLHNK
ncbi:MAG: hypothetical protein WEB57_06120 [Pseudohongiellaceae bacterium]